MTMALPATRTKHRRLIDTIGDEGLRLFFPLAALHGALWPLIWVMLWRLGLPLAGASVPGQWHAQEMLIGAFGAALIGFLTSALPEWTDTARLSGRPLFLLAAFWGVARIAGLIGAEPALPIAAIADQAWLLFLIGYVLYLSWRRRTTAYLGFVLLLAALAGGAAALRLSMWLEAYDAGETAIRIMAFAFLGLLGLALARITVPVTNLVLDPGEETSPYRPHPGRVNLAPLLAGLLVLAEIADLSEAARGYLMVAAGGAFLDRVAEGFVSREGLKWELAGLWLSSALSGIGLLLAGLAAIKLALPVLAAWHLMLMGGLGLAVLQVLSIAGLLHIGQPLAFSKTTKAALWLMLAAVAARVLPEFFPGLDLPGGPHGLAALLWAASLIAWLRAYLPLLWSPATLDQKAC